MSHPGMDAGRWHRHSPRPEAARQHRIDRSVIDRSASEAPVTASAPTFEAAPLPFAQPVTLGRFAASSALVAATTLTVTMAFLAIAHVAGGMRFGDGTHSAIADGLHVVTALALLPIPFALHRLLTTVSPRASAAGVALAVDAIAFAAILHALFAAGVIAFDAAGPLLPDRLPGLRRLAVDRGFARLDERPAAKRTAAGIRRSHDRWPAAVARVGRPAARRGPPETGPHVPDRNRHVLPLRWALPDRSKDRPNGARRCLNFEYARIVEQVRRRSVAERIRIERALHS
jgi:hypothetical protein